MASSKLAKAPQGSEALIKKAHAVLDRNRLAAQRQVVSVGADQTRELLERSSARLEAALMKIAGDSFTAAQKSAALVQIKAILSNDLVPGIKDTLLDNAEDAAQFGAEHVASYLMAADAAFRGVGTVPLSLDTSGMLEAGIHGARSSLLRRLASSGEPTGVDEVPHPAKMGILKRYGTATIGEFERIMQEGLIAKSSWIDMREEMIPLISEGSPAMWAQRIVRTEIMGAYARGSCEAIKEADEELEDMVKILSAVFDDRTGADSYAVHGQIRRPNESFEGWFGAYEAPPNRPNDRESVTPHRIRWPIPAYLRPRGAGEVMLAWRRNGRKGSPPDMSLIMSTVPISEFGKEPKKKPAPSSEDS